MMKTKYWIILFSALILICAGLWLLFSLGGSDGSTARVYSNGELVLSVDLRIEGEYQVDYGEEWNTLKVDDGKIYVSAASCASQDCVHHAPANKGAPIVCLPNRLVIEFSTNEFDAVLK